MPIPSEAAEFQLLTYPGHTSRESTLHEPGQYREIRLFGNRQGILSLANILLWLLARGFERELLSVTRLPFVRVTGAVSLTVRLTDQDGTPQQTGKVRALDKGSQFEWVLPEDDLRRVALALHSLACFYEHEYDLFGVGNVRVHARLTDVLGYLPPRDET
jgi:hypothetical protein